MKTLPHKLLMLCPYLYGALLGACFLLDRFLPNQDSDALLFLSIALFLLMPVPLCLLHTLVSFRQADPAVLTKQNLMWKLSCTPACAASIGILVAAIISTNRAAAAGAMEGGLGIFLWILLLLPVFVCCLAQLIITTITCAKSKETDSAIPWYHILLHLIPIADLLSAILIFRQVSAKRHTIRQDDAQ